MPSPSFVFVNNVNTTLAAPITSPSQTSIVLTSSAGLPTLSGGEVMELTLNDAATQTVFEIMYVTGISGATLTVERGQEGTAATTWLAGDFAFAAITAGILNGFAGAGSGIEAINAGTGIASTGGSSPTISNTGLLNATVGAGLSTTGGQTPHFANTGILAITAGTGLSSTGGASPSLSWTPNKYYYGYSGTTNSSSAFLPPTQPYVILGATCSVMQAYGTTTPNYQAYIDSTNSNFLNGIVAVYVVNLTSGALAGSGIAVEVVIITNSTPV